MQKTYVYLNGRILPADEAAISPFDIGLLRGYAVFDLLRTVKGKPFLLAEHLERFRASAAQLGLTVPVTDAELASAIEELIALNAEGEVTVRMLLSGGVSPDGMSYDPATPTLLMMTHELKEPPASLFENGGKLITREHVREVPEAKTTNYVTMLQHKPLLAEEDALDLLYHRDGRLYEAASASVYAVRDGRILAPEGDVLWGTVGSWLLDRARERYEVVTGPVALDDVLSADEVFLTSTTRGVVPIVQIDERRIGDGVPGPVTRELIALYRREALGE